MSRSFPEGLATDADVTLRIAGAIERSDFAGSARVFWARTEEHAVEGLSAHRRSDPRARFSFFPINVGGYHWVLYVVRPGPRIQFFDAMGGSANPSVARALAAWAGDGEAGASLEELEAEPQRGPTECGWRCAAFASYLLGLGERLAEPAEASSAAISML